MRSNHFFPSKVLRNNFMATADHQPSEGSSNDVTKQMTHTSHLLGGDLLDFELRKQPPVATSAHERDTSSEEIVVIKPTASRFGQVAKLSLMIPIDNDSLTPHRDDNQVKPPPAPRKSNPDRKRVSLMFPADANKSVEASRSEVKAPTPMRNNYTRSHY